VTTTIHPSTPAKSRFGGRYAYALDYIELKPYSTHYLYIFNRVGATVEIRTETHSDITERFKYEWDEWDATVKRETVADVRKLRSARAAESLLSSFYADDYSSVLPMPKPSVLGAVTMSWAADILSRTDGYGWIYQNDEICIYRPGMTIDVTQAGADLDDLYKLTRTAVNSGAATRYVSNHPELYTAIRELLEEV